VDAVAVEHGRLVFIEAKVFKLVDGLAKLPLYASLLPTTPELHDKKDLQVVMRLVAPWTSPNVETMARSQGIEVVVFSPAWIADYVEQYQHYWTAEYREARAERQRLREELGVA